jgi:hypothetical protein
MSRRNIIILISLLILVVAFLVFFYLYNLNKKIPTPIVPPQTDLEIKRQETLNELSQFKIDPEDIKPRETVLKELDSFVPPPPEQTMTKEEILNQLNSINFNP